MDGIIVYEPNAAWAAYYEALWPQERQDILEENLRTLEDDGTHAFRRQLFQERHQDQKNPEKLVDYYLWKCTYLPGLYKKRGAFFGGPGFLREVEQTLRELHLDAPERLTQGEREALYQEFRNAARRYLGTCRGDRYGRKFLGTMGSSADEKMEKACGDIWAMSRGIALFSGTEDRMQLFCDALYDELISFEPRSRAIYEKLEAQGQAEAAEKARKKKRR